MSTDRASFAEIAAVIRTSGSVALDVETYGSRKGDGLDPWAGDIRLLSLCVEDQQPWIIDLRATGYDLGELKTALESAEIIAHNAKFDLLWLRAKCGLRATQGVLHAHRRAPARPPAPSPATTSTSAWIATSACLQPRITAAPTGARMLLTDDQLAYAARDVAHLHDLATKLWGELELDGLDAVAELEMQLVPVIVEMEVAGIGVDTAKLREIETKARASAAEHAPLRCATNLACPRSIPSSPQQLLKALAIAGHRGGGHQRGHAQGSRRWQDHPDHPRLSAALKSSPSRRSRSSNA